MHSSLSGVAIPTLVGGSLMFFVSLPLIFRKVPMNQVYGIRIKASFESDQRWYDINAYGGIQMAAFSWFIIAAGVTGLFLSPQYFTEYSWSTLAVDLLSIFIPVGRTLWWCRKPPL